MLRSNSWLKHQKIHPIRRLLKASGNWYHGTYPPTLHQQASNHDCFSHILFLLLLGWGRQHNAHHSYLRYVQGQHEVCSQQKWPQALSETHQDKASLETHIYIEQKRSSRLNLITFQLKTITTFMPGWYLSLIFTLVSVAGSYWNRIKWRCSTGGKLTKITPFFASWRREDGWEVEELKSNSKLFQNKFPSWPAFLSLQHRTCSPPSASPLPHSPWMTRTLTAWSSVEVTVTANSQYITLLLEKCCSPFFFPLMFNWMSKNVSTLEHDNTEL